MAAKTQRKIEKHHIVSRAKVHKPIRSTSWDTFVPKQKKKVSLRSKLIKELDAIFSKYIRLRDSDQMWMWKCCTCWVVKHWKRMQNCHFITRWNYKYRWRLENCHIWCYRCNIILEWNYINYTLFMIKTYGHGMVERMKTDKQLVKISTPDLKDMIEKYKYEVDLLIKLKKW